MARVVHDISFDLTGATGAACWFMRDPAIGIVARLQVARRILTPQLLILTMGILSRLPLIEALIEL